MGIIRRNTDPMKGPPDGVAADLECVVTSFASKKRKVAPNEYGDERTIKSQAHVPCTVYCSYEDGTIGVSIRGIDLQIDLLVEELMAIMQAGAEANRELTAPQREAYTAEQIAEKWRELQSADWDEADSPSGFILAAAWWIFPRGVDRDDLCAWFGEKHPNGIEYLRGLID